MRRLLCFLRGSYFVLLYGGFHHFVFCYFVFLTSVYNLFLELNFVLWSDGSIQLCQFNFHSWQFDRLFVGQIGLSWNPFSAIEKSIKARNWTTVKNPNLHKLLLQRVCQHCYIPFDQSFFQSWCVKNVCILFKRKCVKLTI